jgi:dipeptidyl aminopeptidase/acylaminoacyl peptidase
MIPENRERGETNVRKMQSSDLLSMKWVSGPEISPDGKSLLFTVRSIMKENEDWKYKTQIYLAKDGKVRPFSGGPKNDTSPRWSPTGDKVVFLSERGKDRTQFHLISMEGGEAIQISHRKEGVGEPVWSPDGSKIAFSAIEPDPKSDGGDKDSKGKSDVRVITRIRYKMNGRGFLPDRRAQIYVLDLATKEVKQLTSGPYDCREPAWSPDGKHIAFVSARYEGHEFSSIRDIYVVPAEGGEMRKVTSSDTVLGGPSYSPDGKWIAFYGHDNAYRGATVPGVCVIPAQGGPVGFLTKEKELAVGSTAGGDMGGSPGTRPTWSGDSSWIYFSALDWGKTHLYKVHRTTKELVQLTSGDCTVLGWKKALHDDTVAVHLGSMTLIGDMFILDPRGRGPDAGDSPWKDYAEQDGEEPGSLHAKEPYSVKRITRVNDELLSSVQLSLPQEFCAVSQDGTKVQGWLMKPVGMKEGRRYPVALEIHGGPHSAYGFVFHHEFQLLAARGYGVVFCNPRGSVGHGQQYKTAIRHNWGGVDYQDIMAAADYAASEPWVDPERMCVLGGSYGGYMTNWIVTQTNRFKAAVTMRSTCNRLSQFGASDAAFMNGDFEFDGDPWDNPRAYLDVSPLMYVRKVQTPIMIIHSEEDLRCPMEQAEEWFTALKKTGKTAVFVRFPGENHELSRSGKPKHRIERLEFIVAWFDRFLAPRDEDYEGGLARPQEPVVSLPEVI